MNSPYFPLRGDQVGQIKFPIGCQVYLVENIDGKDLIKSRATVQQCLLQMTPTVNLLYEVKTHEGEIEIQQQDSLRYQNACRVLYKTGRPAVILGFLTKDSKHWYSIELEDNSEVMYEVDLEDLTGIPVENPNVEVQENEKDGQKNQNSEEQSDQESIVSIEPILRVKEDPDVVDVGNEIIMQNDALDSETDKTIESNHNIDGDNNLQMGHNENNNDNGIANRENLRKPDSISEKPEHNDNVNNTSAGNALVSTSQNSMKELAADNSTRGVLDVEQRQEKKSYGVNRQQDIGIDENCSNKRKRSHSNDYRDNSKSIRSLDSNSRSRRVSTSSSNYQNVENTAYGYCSPCEGGRHSIQDDVNSSRGSSRRDWKIVNGQILFWCDRCKNRGEWTNHRSSHHGNSVLRHNIIFRYSPKEMEPSNILRRIEIEGKIFYSDLLKRGFGVMIVDENAMKEVLSIMDKNNQGFSPHLQVWPSAKRTITSQKVTNYDYHEAMFRPFQKDVNGAIKRDFDNIPTSSWRDTKVCIYYHVLGDCVRDCRCASDHRESGEEKLSQILQWCLRNIKQTNEKIENHHYRKDMFQRHTLHMYKFMTSDKREFPKSQWGNFPMCIQFHVEGFCSGHCTLIQDHRICRQDKLEELLCWCQRHSSGGDQSNQNHSDMTYPVQEVSISNRSFNKKLFGKFAHNIPGMLVQSDTLPLAKLSKRALCLDYHLKGRCKSSCNFDHEECDKEKISELFEWCKTSSSKHNEEINQKYLPQLFESYKDGLRGALRIVNNRQSVPTYHNNEKVCVFYHVMGSCRTDCPFRHRSCSNDMITKLLNWCAECIDAEPRVVSNPDYNEEMFGSFVSSLPSLLRKPNIPTSEFGNFEMCINYHIKSRCKDTCPRAADHRRGSHAKLKELLNWCQTDENPNY
ncbi:predicted protein [Chaetoceros tenuissimus]|uniref:C3H1-type domain-containing protein n=1 Tax=Chaetoceros tenuissimus TaxID=426638 RepID=A0AAD3CI47_9STRA|nr:predicted protein [Chaetoceros tenuissimus]